MSTIVAPPGDSIFGIDIFNTSSPVIVEPIDDIVSVQSDRTTDDPNRYFVQPGSEFDYLIGAGRGDDFAVGGKGDDIIFGQEGSDIIFGLGGEDTIRGGSGNDRLEGNGGNDIIIGGDGRDFLRGGLNDDTLKGGKGNDTIISDAGRDILTGGDGADKFVIGVSRAVITDFNPDEDIIEVSQSLIPGAKIGVLRSNQVATVESADELLEASALLVYNAATGIVYFNPENGRPKAIFEIQPNLSVSAADFRVIP